MVDAVATEEALALATDATAPTEAAPADASAPATEAAPSDAASADAAPTDAPVVDAAATEEALASATDAGLTVVPVDETGAAVSLASAEAAQILSAPDPYFTVGGVTYTFLNTGGDCTGIPNCTVSVSGTPIQDAIEYLSTHGLTPDDGIIYVEAGTYSENVTIDGTNWSTTPAALALFGVSGSGSTTINGSVNIFNLINIALDGFAINGQVAADSNTGNLFLNDLVITNPAGNGLVVTNHSGDISVSNVDSSGNGGDGAYLDNTVGTGNVVVDPSTFNDNSGNGLTVLSDGNVNVSNSAFNNNDYHGLDVATGGAVTLNDITADGNGLSGDYGTGLDTCNWNGADCAGVGSFSLGGTNSFSNNLDNGLNVYSTGAITLSNVTASGNGGDGAYLDNTVGTGNVVVDPSTFNDNGVVGLEVWADAGNVTFTNVTANNNGFSWAGADYPFHGDGASVWAGSGDILVDPSTFNDNAFFGLYAENDGGTITLDRVTASGNGLGTDATDSYSGVRLDTTLGNGNITVTCSTFTGNGYNGISADAATGTMTLNSVTTAGNGVTVPGAPDVFLGSGTLVTNTVECVPPITEEPGTEEPGPGVVLPPPIRVTGGEQVTLYTTTSTSLDLPGGNQVSIDPGVGTTASVTPNTESSLPGALPAGSTFVSAMTVGVMNGGAAVSTLPAGKTLVVSFVIPPSFAGHTFSILYWNPTLNGGLGGWAEVPATVTPDGRVVASVNLTGTFVLVAN